MAFTGRDLRATVFTALALLAFAASVGGWDVPLVGGSVRWAAVAMLVLGMGACASGAPRRDASTAVLSVLGTAALVSGLVALIWASETALWVLAGCIAALWLGSMLRHVAHAPHGAAHA